MITSRPKSNYRLRIDPACVNFEKDGAIRGVLDFVEACNGVEEAVELFRDWLVETVFSSAVAERNNRIASKRRATFRVVG